MSSLPQISSEGGTPTIDEAFAYCERMAREHYENFPVGSLLVPKRLRRHVHSIYAYSRVADDIADEGAMPVAERLALLDEWERLLNDAYAGRATHPVFVALAATVEECGIPIDPLRDLLSAFRLDARNEGFETEADLLAYCDHSANPIGRLVLHLFGLHNGERRALSDRLCTALQITNFLQDLSVDPARGRINLPRESFERFGYGVDELLAGTVDERLRRLVAHHAGRAARMFEQGRPLLRMIPNRRLRWELALTYLGGTRILERIRAMNYDVLTERPTLGTGDKIRILARLAAG